MKYKIEKNIPMPKKKPATGNGFKTGLPFAKMKIGDSFLADYSCRGAIGNTARNNGIEIVTRLTDQGLRVWRYK